LKCTYVTKSSIKSGISGPCKARFGRQDGRTLLDLLFDTKSKNSV
jgi:hypothetical protein